MKIIKNKDIETYAKSYALRMFNDFNNRPEYQGNEFDWKNFPYTVKRLAEVDMFMSFSIHIYKEKTQDKIKEKAGLIAYEEVMKLCKENNKF